jgi:NAD-dependent SIR2 family protein deacetylase
MSAIVVPTSETVTDSAQLSDFVAAHHRLFVLTGAGCSTDSGIPDYRDARGDWKRSPPVTYQAFVGALATRQRYWARSLIGWRRFGRAIPNAAHHALARLEQQGKLALLLTQNVDRLHQAAGSHHVIDLHGRMDVVRCLGCEQRLSRDVFQAELLQMNPAWADLEAADAPDGDADLEVQDFSSFEIPACSHCGGLQKPDVVFFGENVPRDRVDASMQALYAADAVLVVGSSLMVFSGYRFVHAAARAGKPIAAVNIGHTRADTLLSLKVEQSCAQALAFL